MKNRIRMLWGFHRDKIELGQQSFHSFVNLLCEDEMLNAESIELESKLQTAIDALENIVNKKDFFKHSDIAEKALEKIKGNKPASWPTR